MRTRTLARLSTAVTLLFAFAQTAGAASFSDISGSANLDAIEYLHARGVIGGYSDGTFRPNAQINRAELAKILVGADGTIVPQNAYYQNCFTDVREQDWYVLPVCYAQRRSWVQGYSDGSFRPDRPVNTAEAIKMIMESQQIHEYNDDQYNTYVDVDGSAWYAPFVEIANKKHLLQHETGTLGVGANITRGQVAEIIFRAMVMHEKGLDAFDDGQTPPPASAPASSEPAAMETKYRNGTYAAIGVYVSPAGGEQIHVSLTLKDDVVVDSTYEGTAMGGRSAQMQAAFGEGYKEFVIGKKLDEIQLDVVNGSSLTPRGFMDAVAKIKAEAKA